MPLNGFAFPRVADGREALLFIFFCLMELSLQISRVSFGETKGHLVAKSHFGLFSLIDLRHALVELDCTSRTLADFFVVALSTLGACFLFRMRFMHMYRDNLLS